MKHRNYTTQCLIKFLFKLWVLTWILKYASLKERCPISASLDYLSQMKTSKTLCDALRRSIQHRESKWLLWPRGISRSEKIVSKWTNCYFTILWSNVALISLSKFIMMWFLTIKTIYFGGHKSPFNVKTLRFTRYHHQCLMGSGSRWVSGYMVSAWISIQKMH